jgi:hypothetical protein
MPKMEGGGGGEAMTSVELGGGLGTKSDSVGLAVISLWKSLNLLLQWPSFRS